MSIIIGIDHGYGYIKTANTSMITGITQFDSEPFSMQNALEYNGKYYVCGTSRQALTLDKTVNDNYYLLTLAAIAKELKYRQYPHNEAEIILAAGLPLTRFGLEKDRFKTYLSRCPQPVEFRYERQPYKIFIRDVLLYPQGYSAFVSHTGLISKNESSVILADCGSWTLDVMRIDNGIPNANHCMSLDLGMIRCLNDIKEQMRRKLGYAATEAEIEQVLQMEDNTLDQDAQDAILECGGQYVQKVLNALMENGFDTQATSTVFMGGGARLIKNFSSGLFAPDSSTAFMPTQKAMK